MPQGEKLWNLWNRRNITNHGSTEICNDHVGIQCHWKLLTSERGNSKEFFENDTLSLCSYTACGSHVMSCHVLSYQTWKAISHPQARSFFLVNKMERKQKAQIYMYPRIDNLVEQDGDLRNSLTAAASSDRRWCCRGPPIASIITLKLRRTLHF